MTTRLISNLDIAWPLSSPLRPDPYMSIGSPQASGIFRKAGLEFEPRIASYRSNMEPGLIHVIDDDAAVCESLSTLVRSMGNQARVYASVDEFLATDPLDVPSCLLLDVRLPGINGLDFQSSLQRRGIFLPVILMTGYGDIQMSVRGMKAGAVDFLTKPGRHQELLDAISSAIGRDIARRSEAARIGAIRERYETLTPREVEVA